MGKAANMQEAYWVVNYIDIWQTDVLGNQTNQVGAGGSHLDRGEGGRGGECVKVTVRTSMG